MATVMRRRLREVRRRCNHRLTQRLRLDRKEAEKLPNK